MNIFKRLFGRSSNGGETQEFQAFIEGSMEGLRLQTEAHQSNWGFGACERWDFSQEDGELIFTFPVKTARAPAQIIGSFDSLAGSWMWAWANSSVSPALARDSLRVRQYGRKRSISRLTTPAWSAKESDGWQMAALANRLCESNGVYRAPAGDTYVFFTFGEIRLSRRARGG